MKPRHALFLFLLAYITLKRLGWMIHSDMTPYRTGSTAAWFVIGMAAIALTILRYGRRE